MSYWYKNDELDEEIIQPPPPSMDDILVVEPSRQDRNFSQSYDEMVERAWILTRPPPGLYLHEPTVTARQIEVARMNIVGESPQQSPSPCNSQSSYPDGSKRSPGGRTLNINITGQMENTDRKNRTSSSSHSGRGSQSRKSEQQEEQPQASE